MGNRFLKGLLSAIVLITLTPAVSASPQPIQSKSYFSEVAPKTFTRMLWDKLSVEQKKGAKDLAGHAINQSPYSYGIFLPYVTNENGSRTNLGINNYSMNVAGKGSNPIANVFVALVDQNYNIVGTAQYSVNPNQMLQINNVIGSLGGGTMTGWVGTFSDVPVATWASVIINQTNDPSILVGVPDPQFKPSAGREGANGRLLIASSVKTGTFQSSLAVLNSGNKDGTFSVKIFDNSGNLLGTQSRSLGVGQMWVDNDIRAAYPGTYGDLLLEVVPEPGANDLVRPEITAVSLVRSSGATSAFFPGTTLPQSEGIGIAGIWHGTITGNLFNLTVDAYIYQDRDLIYGGVDFLNGTAPFSISQNPYDTIYGEIIGSDIVFNSHSNFLADDTLFTAKIYGNVVGSSFQGKLLWVDEKGNRDKANVSLTKTGTIY